MTEMVYNVRVIRTLRELLEGSVQLFPERIAFLFRRGEGIMEVTYRQLLNDVKALATYFNSLDLAGKKILLTGKNSYEWAVTYLAVTCGTGIIVPVDKELKTDELQNVIELSGIDALVCAPENRPTADACTGSFRRFYTAELRAYIDHGQALRDGGDDSYETHFVDPYAMSILLYTSGTVGVAKGVMLSQNNIAANIMGVLKRSKVTCEDRSLSVLPLHHTYECTAGFLSMLYVGASIAFNESLRNLPADFRRFSPTILVGVPLLFENIRNNIVKKYHALRGGKALYAASLAAAVPLSPAGRAKIFKNVHDFFGGRLRILLDGAAALPPDVFRDFELYGFRVMVGYGLTETAPVCLMHNDFVNDAESVGEPLCNVEARIVDPDANGVGELAVRGENVMLGYYNNPDETAAVLRDGWFYTGDLARVTRDGRYIISGRKKSMIVTKNGKKIFPEELEHYLTADKYIKEALVYGDDSSGETVVCVKLFPDYEAAEKELTLQGIAPDSDEFFVELQQLLRDAIHRANRRLPHYKMIRCASLRCVEFDKTTTRKIRRFSAINLADQPGDRPLSL